MDIQTIDTQYEQLQTQAQQTATQLKALADKLKAARDGGNQDAREWLLDLREVALAMQAEQNQVGNLLQALHNFVANQALAEPEPASSVPQTQPVPAQPPAPPQPWGPPQQAYPQPRPAYPQPYPAQGYPPSYPQQSGGLLGGFMNSGFGRAIAMGAGFGLGDDLINSIF